MRPQTARHPLVVKFAAVALMLAFACDNQPAPCLWGVTPRGRLEAPPGVLINA